MATRFDAIMARRGEIMRKALGMDYSEFELSPIAFDYERMMTAHGYSLDDIVGIQTRAGVGNTPLLELKNLTDLVRSISAPGQGARIRVLIPLRQAAGPAAEEEPVPPLHLQSQRAAPRPAPSPQTAPTETAPPAPARAPTGPLKPLPPQRTPTGPLRPLPPRSRAKGSAPRGPRVTPPPGSNGPGTGNK